MESVNQYIKAHQDAALTELLDYLKIPSISADPKFQPQCGQAAQYLADKLKTIGMENVQMIGEKGHATIYADWLHAPGKPTILIYGHYDVQPPDPLNLWETPPFEPTIRDGMIYARGSDDNKGQHLPWVRAVEAWLATEKKLPVNVKFVVEGEEECGGKVIAGCMAKKEFVEAWKCDAVAISDSSWFSHDLPSIDVGMRGMCYFELEVNGAKMDLHSGVYGNAAPNPIMALARAFTKIQNDQGRILIPGFYDDVQELSAEDREMIRSLPFSNAAYCKEIGIQDADGEPEYSYLERTWTRPSFEVHGIVGGYVGAGGKTVIPATATAKISIRLAPDQRPDKVKASLEAHLKTVMPKTVRWELRSVSEGGYPLVVESNNPFLKALSPVYQETYGKKPVYTRSGGSIPVATLFARAWKVPVMFMGLGYHDDLIHSPNEHFPVSQFRSGMELAARALEAWGDVKK